MAGTLILVVIVMAISGATTLADPMLELQSSQPLITVQSLWENFQADYNKTYESELEKDMRGKIFESNVKYITQHNELYTKGEKSHYLGINQFTDLTHLEFLQMYTSEIKPIAYNNATTYLPPLNADLPTSVDWRTKGYVTKVKNQEQCGSCWAFSVTGAIEGQHFRKTHNLVSLSEQQLVDCSKKNKGCNGGIMPVAMEYVKDNGGIEGETDYPYLAKASTCKFRKSLVKATVSGVVLVRKGSESELQNAVSNVGPISVGIDASHRSFQSYRGGVYSEPSCSSTHLDHGVLVVGYGTSTSDYWLVKNSWGTSWGESGYIKMTRNKNNQCGIATGASYPTV